jgi:multisubunit Na+/H+ antiporter MnhB subunit
MIMIREMLRNSSLLGLLGLLVSLATVAMALAYAIRPNEQRLALMRPLSLAAVFGALNSFTGGIANVLWGIAGTSTFPVPVWNLIAAGVAEAITSLFVTFGCLTMAWLLVALGLRRS